LRATDDSIPGLRETLQRTVYRHSRANQHGLAIGVFVGTLERGRIVVQAALPLQGEAQTSARLLIDEWTDIQRAAVEQFGDIPIVGWYVSRPGGNGQLTPQEVSVHTRAFPRPESFVLGLDPVSNRATIFGWHHGRLEPLEGSPRAATPRSAGRPEPTVPRAAHDLSAAASAPEHRSYAFGMFELDPGTGLPTPLTLVCTGAVGFAVTVLVWVLALR
jgi:hypothetical protein